MRHGLSGLPTCGLNGHKKEMSTPPTPLTEHHETSNTLVFVDCDRYFLTVLFM